MRSFEFDKKTIRDSKVPSGAIPQILFAWLGLYYYGGGLTALDMRKFLERKLREGLFPHDVVEAWIKESEQFRATVEAKRPGIYSRFLEEYYQIRIAA